MYALLAIFSQLLLQATFYHLLKLSSNPRFSISYNMATNSSSLTPFPILTLDGSYYNLASLSVYERADFSPPSFSIYFKMKVMLKA